MITLMTMMMVELILIVMLALCLIARQFSKESFTVSIMFKYVWILCTHCVLHMLAGVEEPKWVLGVWHPCPPELAFQCIS